MFEKGGPCQNSTFSQNTATDGGAALYINGGAANTFSDTFTQNTGGSGLLVYGAVRMQNTIFAGGVESNCDFGEGLFTSLGNNISTDGTCSLSGSQDQQNVTAPILSTDGLRDNGGPTMTVALASSSVAIDAGSAQCPAFDQTGTPRPQGMACDIGAVESTTGTPLSIPSPDTYTVTTLDDHDDGFCDEDCSLREAILYSAGGNTIQFAEGLVGTVNLTSTLSIDHDLVIQGPGSKKLSISGQGAYQPFNIYTAVTVTLSDMTIMNGLDNDADGGLIYSEGNLALSHMGLQGGYAIGYGGAIASYGTSLRLNDVVVNGNYSETSGGAIYAEQDLLSVVSSTFSGNTSGDTGGALYLSTGDVDISGSTFSTNQSYNSGGAILIAAADVTVSSTLFTANKTENAGGGAIDHESARLTLNNVTFDGNATKGGSEGGAIYGNGSELIISSSTFTGNVSPSSNGGAVYVCEDTTIHDTIFTGNEATYSSGGAVYQAGCGTSLSIEGSTFQSNSTGDDGGAIYGDGYGMTITGTTFSNNASVYGYGGAIYQSSNNLDLSDSIFTGNVSIQNGGAIYADGDHATIARSTFEKNSAFSGASGGAIEGCETLTIQDTTFQDNAAVDGVGGAVHQECGHIDMTNSLISGNTAWLGGGVFLDAGNLSSFANTTFFQNVAHLDGGAILSEDYASLTNDTFSQNTGPSTIYADNNSLRLQNSVVNDGASACGWGAGGMVVSIGHNVDAGSSCPFMGSGDLMSAATGLDPRGPQNHGGYTKTIALIDGSVAIDAGTNAGCSAADARGVTRPQGATCDAGAFEQNISYIAPAALDGDIVVTTLQHRDSGECVPGDCSLFEAVNYSDSGAVITFATGLTGVIATDGMDRDGIIVDHSITIRGSTPNAVTISGLGNSTVFTVDPDVTFRVEGMTLAAGYGTWGGAINADGANVIVTTSTFRGNQGTEDGGAIAHSGDVLSITDSTLAGNYADGSGGALYMDGGPSSVVTGSSFIGNYADTHGGSIFHDTEEALVTSTEFIANQSNSLGGAIFDQSVGGINVGASTFAGNISGSSGGAIDFWTGPGVVIDTEFTGNHSPNSNGGAVIADENQSLAISGATRFIGNSSSYDGGALTLCTSETTIDGGVFIANNDLGEGGGGAIGLYCGELRVTGYDSASVFKANLAWGGGGAIEASSNDDAFIHNTQFSGNSSLGWRGGAISSDDGYLTIVDSSFERNASDNNGGAVNLEREYATQHIRRSLFSENAAMGSGGAVSLAGGWPYVEGSVFTRNTTRGDVGGALSAAGYLSIDGTYFANNTAPSDAGGAIWFSTMDSGAYLSNATFFQNSTLEGGGAIQTQGATWMYASTLTQNSGYTDTGSIEAVNASMTVGSSIIADIKGCAASGEGAAVTSAGYNLTMTSSTCAFTETGDATTANPGLDPNGATDHGGFTPTIGLSDGSPALDASTGWCSETDQRGRFRPVNATGLETAYCDIGAYEKDVLSPATPPSAVQDLGGWQSEHSVELTWNMPESYGNAAIYDYLFQYRLHGDERWIRYGHIPTTTRHYVIDGLSASSQYDFQVAAINYAGVGATAEETLATSDATAPTILGGLSLAIVISPTHEQLVWNTDQNSSSWIEYGLTTEYGSSTTEQDTFPRVTVHTVDVTGLIPCSLYHAKLYSRNAEGLTGESGDITFSTYGCDNVTISDVAATPGSTTATIAWLTNDVTASSQVVYGPGAQYNSFSDIFNVFPKVNEHSVDLSDLVPCTLYSYKVASMAAFFNASTSTGYSFATKGCIGGGEPRSTTSTTVTVSDGGAIHLDTEEGNRFSVTSTAGFTSTSSHVEIQIKSLLGNPVFGILGKPSSDLSAVSVSVFDVKALIDSVTLLDSFDTPVTVSYHYLDADVAGLDESTLQMYHYHEGAWVPLTGCSVNTTDNIVTCTAPSFSIFATFGSAPVTVSSGGNSSGSGGGGAGSGPIYGCMDVRATNYAPYATASSTRTPCQYVPLSASATSTPVALPPVKPNELSCTEELYVQKSIRLGSKNDIAEVKLLQKYLNTYEGTHFVIDGIYSKANRDAVIKWQEKYADDILKPWGLKKGTGYVFTTSLKKMEALHKKACAAAVVAPPASSSTPAPSPAPRTRVLKVGDTGNDVLQLQVFLNAHGFVIAKTGVGSVGHETTLFGNATKKALMAFQKSKKLKPTGMLDDKTRAVINGIK